MSDERRPVHAANELNELPGEEWLYFTKSLLTTAYPSELGHAARRVHGANKPPRLMARLIEFFSRTGETVLDPFAGVGGTLLGAAIARGPRRAIGIELEPRWATVYESVVRDLTAERDGAGPVLADLGPADPGGPRGFDPSGVRLVIGDATGRPARRSRRVRSTSSRPTRPTTSSCRMTMAGGVAGRGPRQPPDRLRDGHRCTGRPRERARLRDLPRPDARASSPELRRVLREGRYAVVIVRDAYQDGRYVFTGSDLAAEAAARRSRPEGRPHLVPGRDAAPAVRLPAGIRPEHRPPARARVPGGGAAGHSSRRRAAR